MRRFVALSLLLFGPGLLGLAEPTRLYARSDGKAAAATAAAAVEVGSGGTLAGTVRTLEGVPVPQLALEIDGPSGTRVLHTGPTGRFAAAGLLTGSYRLAPRSGGFALVTQDRAAATATGEGELELVVEPARIEERIVVTAARGEAIASLSGVATTLLDEEEIAERSAVTLLDLLGGLPGLTAARTGGTGSQGSIFVRGGESDAVRILVDGVPINEPGGAYDLGPTLPLELERVELVRGAASALYGTDALAGVLQLVTRRGAGAPTVRFEAEAGSESWERALAGASGSSDRHDWSLGLQNLETDNEIPNNAFDSEAGALAAGLAPSAASALRLVLRGSESRIGTPGPVAFGRPDLDAYFDRTDVAAGVAATLVRGEAEHELRLGWSSSEQLSVNPLDSGPYVPRAGDRVSPFTFFDFPNPAGFLNDTDRLAAGWRSERRAGRTHIVSAGVDFERETGRLGDRSLDLLEPERENWGVYVQDRLPLGSAVYLTAGGRLEDNASFGTRFVPRVALAWEQDGGARVVRASAGAGIKEPSLTESFGVSFFARGNPDLEPEESRTFDLGLVQSLANGRLRLEGALFHHEYERQIAFEVIDFETFEGSFVNLGESRARGLELSLDARPVSALRVSAHYTWLDGEILVSGNAFSPIFAAGRTLLRRPEHEGSLVVQGSSGRFHPGARLLVVGRRADSDFAGIGLEESPSYARLDLRLRVELASRVDLVAGADNVLDEQYQEAMGFPALGRSVRVGFTARVGDSRGR